MPWLDRSTDTHERESFGIDDEQTSVALPLAARQDNQRPEKPVRTRSLKPDEADWAIVVGEREESRILLPQVIGGQARRIQGQAKHIILLMRDRREDDPAYAVPSVCWENSRSAAKCAATAPTSWATMKVGTQTGAMPAKLLLNDRAIVIAGFAKLVDDVNQ